MTRILILTIVVAFFAEAASAQWNQNTTTSEVYYLGGNVGVGTDDPNVKLHILGDATVQKNAPTLTQLVVTNSDVSTTAARARVFVRNGSVAGYLEPKGYAGSEGLYIGSETSHKLHFETGTVVRSTIDLNGNLGIGTPNPAAKLDVRGDANFYSYGTDNTLNLGRDADQKLKFFVEDRHAYVDFKQDVDDNGSHIWYFRHLGLGTSPNNDILFQTGGADRLTIKGNGHVGIGKAPLTKLHIAGQLAIDPGATINPIIFTNASSSGSHNYLWLLSTPSVHAATGLKAGGILVSDTYNYANPGKNDLVVKGNILVGTATPDAGGAKLAVNGTIHAEEVLVDLGVAGPDYVFESNYNLPSLDSIETYIKANKHLPEVPSAKEMEANGISLSEMNMILLKKVEELTLHLIEQNKKLKTVQDELEQIRREKQ